jgi:hypothetical protein
VCLFVMFLAIDRPFNNHLITGGRFIRRLAHVGISPFFFSFLFLLEF